MSKTLLSHNRVDQVTGVGKCKSEGSANVHINDTIHLTSSVTCGKVKYISLDVSSAPKVITNVEKHKQFKQYYRLQFRIYPEDSNVDITPDASHNVHFECRSHDPEWVIARTEEDETKGKVKSAVCIVIPKPGSKKESAPSVVRIEVSAGSKELQYMKSEKFSFPFVSAFNMLSGKELAFSKNDRTKIIKIAGNTDLRVWVDDPSTVDIRTIPSDIDGITEIQVTVPRDVTTTFKGNKLYVENTLTGQKEETTINFYYEAEQEKPIDTTTTSWSIADILTVLILILTVIILVKCILWSNNANDEYRPPRVLRNPNMQGYRTPAVQQLGGRATGSGGNLSNFTVLNK